ncbi:hypothetical protein [Tsukamurella serpentis]
MTRRDESEPGRVPGRRYSASDIARIFGDVLPSQTKDDLPDGAASGAEAAPSASADSDAIAQRTERWYRENRPPHHGG